MGSQPRRAGHAGGNLVSQLDPLRDPAYSTLALLRAPRTALVGPRQAGCGRVRKGSLSSHLAPTRPAGEAGDRCSAAQPPHGRVGGFLSGCQEQLYGQPVHPKVGMVAGSARIPEDQTKGFIRLRRTIIGAAGSSKLGLVVKKDNLRVVSDRSGALWESRLSATISTTSTTYRVWSSLLLRASDCT